MKKMVKQSETPETKKAKAAYLSNMVHEGKVETPGTKQSNSTFLSVMVPKGEVSSGDAKRRKSNTSGPEDCLGADIGADIEADIGGNIVKNKLNNRFKAARMALRKHQMMIGL